MRRFILGAFALMAIAASSTAAFADPFPNPFTVSSPTFAAGKTIPTIMLNDYEPSGSNLCSVNGATGGNQSPALNLSGVPAGTRSFVVVAYDVTAAFTHWGMYNIPGTVRSLPLNASAAANRHSRRNTAHTSRMPSCGLMMQTRPMAMPDAALRSSVQNSIERMISKFNAFWIWPSLTMIRNG